MADIAEIGFAVDTSDLEKANSVLDKIANKEGKIRNAARGISSAFERIGKSAGRAAGAMGKRGLQAGAAGSQKALLALTAGMGTALFRFSEFEQRLIGIGKTTGASGAELTRLGEEIQAIAGVVPVATNRLLEIGEAAGQLGITGTDNIAKFTKTIGQLGIASDLSGERAATQLTRIINITGESISNIDRFASVLVKLGNTSAATESEIANVASRVAQATSAFEVSAQETAAFGAALRSLGVQSELGGSAIGRTFREIQSAISDGGDAFDRLQELTGRTGDELRRIINNNPTQLFLEFVQGLDKTTFSAGQLNQSLEEFNIKGNELLQVIPSLVTNSDLLAQKLAAANKEYKENNALTEEALVAAQSFSSQMRLLFNEIDETAVAIGRELAPVIVEASKQFREFLNDVQGTDAISDFVEDTVRSILNFAKTVASFFEQVRIFFKSVEKTLLDFKSVMIDVGGVSLTIARDVINALETIVSALKNAPGAELVGAIGPLNNAEKSLSNTFDNLNKRIDENIAAQKELEQQINNTVKEADQLRADAAATSPFEEFINSLIDAMDRFEQKRNEITRGSTTGDGGLFSSLFGAPEQAQRSLAAADALSSKADELGNMLVDNSEKFRLSFEDATNAAEKDLARFLTSGELQFDSFIKTVGETASRDLVGILSDSVQQAFQGGLSLQGGGTSDFATIGAGAAGAAIAGGFAEELLRGEQSKLSQAGSIIAGGLTTALTGNPALGAAAGGLAAGIFGTEQTSENLRLEIRDGLVFGFKEIEETTSAFFGLLEDVDRKFEDLNPKIRRGLETLLDETDNFVTKLGVELGQNFSSLVEDVTFSGQGRGNFATVNLQGLDPEQRRARIEDIFSRIATEALDDFAGLSEQAGERLEQSFTSLKDAFGTLDFLVRAEQGKLFQELDPIVSDFVNLFDKFQTFRARAERLGVGGDIQSQFIEAQGDLIQDATKEELMKLKQFVQESDIGFADELIQNINQRFSEITAKELAEASKESLEVLAERQEKRAELERNLQDELLRLQGKELELFERNAQRRIQEAEDLGADITLLERVLAEKRKQIIEDQNQDIIRNLEDQSRVVERSIQEQQRRRQELLGAAGEIADFRRGLLTSNISPLSPGAQFSAAQSEFQRTLGEARGGGIGAFQDLQGASRTLLEQAQSRFGASPEFFNVFNEVRQGLREAESGARTAAEAQLQEVQKSNQRLSEISAKMSRLNAQIDELSATNREQANELSKLNRGSSKKAAGARE